MRKYKILFLFICVFAFVLLTPAFVSANGSSGEGNVDGGGGANDLQEGSAQNNWVPGNDGVRISIVDAETGTTMYTPIDWSRNNQWGKDIKHFGKYSKLSYLAGKNLSFKFNNYSVKVPDVQLPTIISSNQYGNSSSAEIKNYFTDNRILKEIAKMTVKTLDNGEKVALTFEELTSGEYKIVIEPIIYLTFAGDYYAMTAHEFAMYDIILGNQLRSKFLTVGYKNLALSMFLEEAELGVGVWTGGRNQVVSIQNIITYLGIGIIHFDGNPTNPIPPTDPEGNPNPILPGGIYEVSTSDYTYHTNTSVITSIEVSASKDITPADPMSVTFYINGNTYSIHDIVIPEGGSQLVWCKWTTPSKPTELTAYAYIEGQGTVSIPIVVKELTENEPPDTNPHDKRNGWEQIPSHKIPFTTAKSRREWSKWYAIAHREVWYEQEEITDGSGNPVLDGDGNIMYDEIEKERIYYTWHKNYYYAEVSTNFKLSPDVKCPTAEVVYGAWQIKSAYGVDALVKQYINSNAPSSSYSRLQNCIFYFPEFNYESYWRVGVKDNNGHFTFRNNKYSHFNTPTHFTPLWYPDGEKNYIVKAHIIDSWTPAGQLTYNDTDHVSIKGTMYDDWHIGEVLIDGTE